MSRLEEIRKRYGDDREIAKYAGITLILKDYDWLINRVYELEEESRFQMSETHKNLDKVIYLDKENQRYKRALEHVESELDYAYATGAEELRDKIIKGAIATIERALKGESK